MSERVHENGLSLQTDPPPDRLGDRAFDLRNFLPASPISLRPRDGTTVIGHYAQGQTGRALVVENAPGRTDGRLVLLTTRTTDPGGALPLVTSLDGVAEWMPVGTLAAGAPALGTEPPPFEWGDFGSAMLADLLIGFVI